MGRCGWWGESLEGHIEGWVLFVFVCLFGWGFGFWNVGELNRVAGDGVCGM